MLQQWQALSDQRSRHKRELYLQVGLEMLSQLTKLTCCVFIPQQWNYENNGIKCFWPLFDDPVLTCLGFNKGELRDPIADSGDLTFQQVGDVSPETSCALRLMGVPFFPVSSWPDVDVTWTAIARPLAPPAPLPLWWAPDVQTGSKHWLRFLKLLMFGSC